MTTIGDLGVTLLLFTIGLKLDLRSLLRPVIWAGTTLHTAIVIAVLGTLLYWMSLAGMAVFEFIEGWYGPNGDTRPWAIDPRVHSSASHGNTIFCPH